MSERTRPATRLPAAERRRQLLDVALGVFAANGFHGASMDAVAEAAGVTKPVLYQHFRSKRALYLELLEDVGSRLTDLIAKATADVDGPREQVEAGFAAYFRFVVDHESAFHLLFSGSTQGEADFAAAVDAVEQRLAEAVATLIDADVSADHRLHLAHGIVGMAEAVVRHLLADGVAVEPQVLARRTATLAWAGLRGVHRD